MTAWLPPRVAQLSKSCFVFEAGSSPWQTKFLEGRLTRTHLLLNSVITDGATMQCQPYSSHQGYGSVCSAPSGLLGIYVPVVRANPPNKQKTQYDIYGQKQRKNTCQGRGQEGSHGADK